MLGCLSAGLWMWQGGEGSDREREEGEGNGRGQQKGGGEAMGTAGSDLLEAGDRVREEQDSERIDRERQRGRERIREEDKWRQGNQGREGEREKLKNTRLNAYLHKRRLSSRDVP